MACTLVAVLQGLVGSEEAVRAAEAAAWFTSSPAESIASMFAAPVNPVQVHKKEVVVLFN